VESERNRRSGKAALKAVVDAHAKLVGVDLSKAAADSYAALEKQLDAVISKAGELKEKLSKYKREVASKESRKP
jgi:ribosome-associated translation inhibitor RaiA